MYKILDGKNNFKRACENWAGGQITWRVYPNFAPVGRGGKTYANRDSWRDETL
jgi:hypothetical protein